MERKELERRTQDLLNEAAKLMGELNAGYFAYTARDSNGNAKAAFIFVHGEVECAEIVSACEEISNSWNEEAEDE